MKALLLQLSGGDRRSIGRANNVAVAVLADPGSLDELFAGLTHGDRLVRMGISDLARADAKFRQAADTILRKALVSGMAAMKARARKPSNIKKTPRSSVR